MFETQKVSQLHRRVNSEQPPWVHGRVGLLLIWLPNPENWSYWSHGHREQWVFFRSPPPLPLIKCLFNSSLPNFNLTITLNLEGKCPLHISVLRTCVCPMLLFSLTPHLHCGSVHQSTQLVDQAQVKQALRCVLLLRGLPRILESSLFLSSFLNPELSSNWNLGWL